MLVTHLLHKSSENKQKLVKSIAKMLTKCYTVFT